MRRRRPEMGFTLVELGVVLAVVMVIIAASASRLMRATDDARFDRTLADMRGAAMVGRGLWLRFGLTPRTNLTAPPPNVAAILPPGFSGFNAWGNPLFVAIVPAGAAGERVVVDTCVDQTSRLVANHDSRITSAASGCAVPFRGAGVTLTWTEMQFPSETTYGLRYEKKFLYQQ